MIIDAGVTVYGSRDPRNYQDPSTPEITCGNYGPVATYKVGKGCLPLVGLTGYSGVYGYGVIDGQGDKLLLGGIVGEQVHLVGTHDPQEPQVLPG